jgi:hypothetical protein
MTFFLTKGRELIVDENGYVCGPTRIFHLLVLDENSYDFFLTKGRELIMNENEYVRGPTRILHLLVLYENCYELFPHEG